MNPAHSSFRLLQSLIRCSDIDGNLPLARGCESDCSAGRYIPGQTVIDKEIL